MVDAKSLCYLTILLLSFCFMVVKCSLEPTDQFIDNPTDTKQDALTLHKRPSFFVGSRYGRSGSSSSGSSLFATSKTRRLNVVPRNDRFFLSSRYGKRAEISTGTQLSNKPVPQQQQQQQQQLNDMVQQQLSSSSLSPYAYMSCVYTGLQNYYRCNSIDSMFSFKNAAINDDDDNNNEVLSTFNAGAALLNDNHDDNDDNVDNDDDNDVDDDVNK